MNNGKLRRTALPVSVALALLFAWHVLCATGILSATIFPSPLQVWDAAIKEIGNGRLINDAIASLYRVMAGFLLAAPVGVALGLWLGLNQTVRTALLPGINFMRSLSPLAWIPFAIVWFGVGDSPTIFLIFMAAVFPIAISVIAACSTIPSVYYKVAKDYGLSSVERLTKITIPAIGPQLIAAFRITALLCWLVVVAAEMIAGRDGLGFAIWDSRNGLRMDLLVLNMIAIGLIGIAADRIIAQLTKLPNVRWGYER